MKPAYPSFYTRGMRAEMFAVSFRHKACSAVYFYRSLTGDTSPNDAKEVEIDTHVHDVLSKDSQTITDLHESCMSDGHTKYHGIRHPKNNINEDIGIAVDDRRHSIATTLQKQSDFEAG